MPPTENETYDHVAQLTAEIRQRLDHIENVARSLTGTKERDPCPKK